LSVEEVNQLMKNGNKSEEEKQKRLYTEIRYARDTALSIPKSSDIFRLLKNYKKLSVNVYATNLKVYLGNISCRAYATVMDKMLAK